MVTFAIVGRPNVGKSTLFNRLIGRQHAIVDDQPGVTRDRREGDGRLASLRFRVIDTAGLEDASDGSLEDRMRYQTELAIAEADATLMVVDARVGITPIDKFFAGEIRKSGAQVILVCNKCEGKIGASGVAESWSLGLGEPVAISAAHGEGLVDLHDAMLEAAGKQGLADILTGDDTLTTHEADTPDTPATPDTPDTPDTPATPATPDTPKHDGEAPLDADGNLTKHDADDTLTKHEADTPDTPDTPEHDGEALVDLHDAMLEAAGKQGLADILTGDDTLTTHEDATPDTPDIPNTPEHDGEGLVDLHDAMLEAAGKQGLADILTGDGNLTTHEDDTPATPATPDIPNTPDTPDTPATPAIPATPDAPNTPEHDGEAPLDADGNPIDMWQDEAGKQPMRIAIVGRPNMGKSTLINSLLDEDRLLVGPEAGITRDAIELPFEWQGRPYKLVDTAGMRRRARVVDKVEKLMVDDALRAIQYAHLCVLLVDATEELHKQDLSIARLIANEGRAIVIGANKWDAVRNKQESARQISDRLKTSMSQLKGVPVVQMSGLHKRGLGNLLKAADDMYAIWNMRVSTGRLNRWLEIMLEAHPPPLVEGRRLRIRYITQIKTRPPTFALFVSRPADLPDSYLRYLSTGLRNDFGLRGIPIRMVMRKRENPFA